MLFDLRGSGRRTTVKVVYITLAILMGGGLVLFGIGGDVSGGLVDAFKGGNDGGGGNAALEKQIEREQKALGRNPQDVSALKHLIRYEYQLATSQTKEGAVGFPKEARDELAKAGAYWKRYLDAEKGRPDPSLATVALQVFDVTALNKPKDAEEAARIVAEDQNTSAAYIRLVQYASLAGDGRTADLAAAKAVDLAPKSERTAVKAQVKQAKQAAASVGSQGGGATP
jgi:hypothetical protein